jgi:hypothetical protein
MITMIFKWGTVPGLYVFLQVAMAMLLYKSCCYPYVSMGVAWVGILPRQGVCIDANHYDFSDI